MPERVVCDTSPLFYLHRLRHLSLLQNLYQHILVPEAVVTESRAGHDQEENVPDLAQYSWVTIHRVRTEDALSLMTDLGAGEAHVLALALQIPDSLVIMDDRYARELARQRFTHVRRVIRSVCESDGSRENGSSVGTASVYVDGTI